MSQIRPITCEFNTDVRPNLIHTDVIDCGWQDSIRQQVMPEICRASEIALKVPGAETKR